mgnify:FL=1
MVKKYLNDYVKYFPEKWEWSLKEGQNERYMETRARRTRSIYGGNEDILPDFSSLEKDAADLRLSHYSWTDVFGLQWEGKKGCLRYVGAPDYKGSLYYHDEDSDWADEDGWVISDEYSEYDNPPPKESYFEWEDRGDKIWTLINNIKNVEYKYIVDNHLFKDTHFVITYYDGEEEWLFGNYAEFLKALTDKGCYTDIVEKLYDTIDEHFAKLRDSEREEEREFWPGKTAREYFADVLKDREEK